MEILPEDAGVIRCICGYTHDDSFTIQCEHCNAWQHAKCVNINDDSAVPDNYLCPECSGTPLDRTRAQALQQQFLLEIAQQLKAAPRQTSGSSSGSGANGRKRSEPRPKPDLFDPRFCNIPRAENSWTEAARTVVADVPAVSSRELRAPANLSVVRRQAPKWRFGLNDATVVSESALGAHKFVCEAVGEVMTAEEYAADKHNQFARLGCPKRGVVFVPGLPLVVDSRRRGSQAVFLRRSSDPNCQVVARRDQRGELRALIVTIRAVKPGDELTLGWFWPANHPVRTGESPGVLRTLYWLLDTTDCRPCDLDEPENWEITRAVEVVPRRRRPAEDLPDIAGGEDPAVGLPAFVWEAATQNVPPPPKKRMSLADYMRKRA